MTARDDLAELIHGECGYPCPPGTARRLEDRRIAERIIAAGWRPPRQECADDTHEFYDICAFCGVDASEYYNRGPG